MLHLLFLGALAIPSDDTFIVDFQTDVKNVTGGAGTISILLNRSLAPLGVDHVRSLCWHRSFRKGRLAIVYATFLLSVQLRTLVEDNFYDGAAFFRVVPNFVVQVGRLARLSGLASSSGCMPPFFADIASCCSSVSLARLAKTASGTLPSSTIL